MNIILSYVKKDRQITQTSSAINDGYFCDGLFFGQGGWCVVWRPGGTAITTG
jgi:hypothetical protein